MSTPTHTPTPDTHLSFLTSKNVAGQVALREQQVAEALEEVERLRQELARVEAKLETARHLVSKPARMATVQPPLPQARPATAPQHHQKAPTLALIQDARAKEVRRLNWDLAEAEAERRAAADAVADLEATLAAAQALDLGKKRRSNHSSKKMAADPASLSVKSLLAVERRPRTPAPPSRIYVSFASEVLRDSLEELSARLAASMGVVLVPGGLSGRDLADRLEELGRCGAVIYLRAPFPERSERLEDEPRLPASAIEALHGALTVESPLAYLVVVEDVPKLFEDARGPASPEADRITRRLQAELPTVTTTRALLAQAIEEIAARIPASDDDYHYRASPPSPTPTAPAVPPELASASLSSTFTFLVGPPGSGKSAVLAQLAERLAQDPSCSVTLISCGVGRMRLLGCVMEAVTAALKAPPHDKRVAVLVDGVDHIEPGPGSDSWLPTSLPARVSLVVSGSLASLPDLEGVAYVRLPAAPATISSRLSAATPVLEALAASYDGLTELELAKVVPGGIVAVIPQLAAARRAGLVGVAAPHTLRWGRSLLPAASASLHIRLAEVMAQSQRPAAALFHLKKAGQRGGQTITLPPGTDAAEARWLVGPGRDDVLVHVDSAPIRLLGSPESLGVASWAPGPRLRVDTYADGAFTGASVLHPEGVVAVLGDGSALTAAEGSCGEARAGLAAVGSEDGSVALRGRWKVNVGFAVASVSACPQCIVALGPAGELAVLSAKDGTLTSKHSVDSSPQPRTVCVSTNGEQVAVATPAAALRIFSLSSSSSSSSSSSQLTLLLSLPAAGSSHFHLYHPVIRPLGPCGFVFAAGPHIVAVDEGRLTARWLMTSSVTDLLPPHLASLDTGEVVRLPDPAGGFASASLHRHSFPAGPRVCAAGPAGAVTTDGPRIVLWDHSSCAPALSARGMELSATHVTHVAVGVKHLALATADGLVTVRSFFDGSVVSETVQQATVTAIALLENDALCVATSQPFDDADPVTAILSSAWRVTTRGVMHDGKVLVLTEAGTTAGTLGPDGSSRAAVAAADGTVFLVSSGLEVLGQFAVPSTPRALGTLRLGHPLLRVVCADGTTATCSWDPAGADLTLEPSTFSFAGLQCAALYDGHVVVGITPAMAGIVSQSNPAASRPTEPPPPSSHLTKALSNDRIKEIPFVCLHDFCAITQGGDAKVWASRLSRNTFQTDAHRYNAATQRLTKQAQ
jgi:shikimate kinase